MDLDVGGWLRRHSPARLIGYGGDGGDEPEVAEPAAMGGPEGDEPIVAMDKDSAGPQPYGGEGGPEP